MVKRDNKRSPHVQLDCLYNAYLLFLGCQFGLFAGGRVGLHKFAFFLAWPHAMLPQVANKGSAQQATTNGHMTKPSEESVAQNAGGIIPWLIKQQRNAKQAWWLSKARCKLPACVGMSGEYWLCVSQIKRDDGQRVNVLSLPFFQGFFFLSV